MCYIDGQKNKYCMHMYVRVCVCVCVCVCVYGRGGSEFTRSFQCDLQDLLFLEWDLFAFPLMWCSDSTNATKHLTRSSKQRVFFFTEIKTSVVIM
jgi:hypothetical protein